ncbi:alpha/beta hydrolase [Tropicimonas sediminicola]|uniref:Alpha/beta hydrolase fold n=1 Tax=Tropicimonas sediminicola TaxID=1031541 RepID=A0A239KF53_9RHOB|nr:alpha/beta hydrolase [Tropicimonas sediminicola]SNT16620.1 alpha/beta hydrolase fold [Tropicimonas sediminicola]
MIDPTSYDNADFIPDGHSYFDRWAAAAEAFRSHHPASLQRLDTPYGPGEREKYDLFLPDGAAAPEGLFVFLHGGFWRMSGRKDWSHLAQGFLGNNWAVAIPSYPLAPEVHIAEITQAIARALPVIATELPGPVLVGGHSAGGHLSLRMVCPDIHLPEALRRRIRGVLPISPLADLNPLIMLPMNEFLRIDAAEAESESPILHPEPDCGVQLEVGGAERPSFVDQAIRLADAWLKSDLTITPGRHHFDILVPLADPQSDMVQRALRMARG